MGSNKAAYLADVGAIGAAFQRVGDSPWANTENRSQASSSTPQRRRRRQPPQGAG
jgi:hypothetical protein